MNYEFFIKYLLFKVIHIINNNAVLTSDYIILFKLLNQKVEQIKQNYSRIRQTVRVNQIHKSFTSISR